MKGQWRCSLGLHSWSRWGTPVVECVDHWSAAPCKCREVVYRYCGHCNLRVAKVLRNFEHPCPARINKTVTHLT